MDMDKDLADKLKAIIYTVISVTFLVIFLLLVNSRTI